MQCVSPNGRSRTSIAIAVSLELQEFNVTDSIVVTFLLRFRNARSSYLLDLAAKPIRSIGSDILLLFFSVSRSFLDRSAPQYFGKKFRRSKVRV
ncbi:hypothetical protein CKA32_006022 [Geitlerinema sp. FC II]|nr:hypothetical protein CKA32_006022 [Geitlerinema sp. FC II]